ncbi:MAG: nitroreductase family protein [Opitutales bacterium]|nr:nitroreductase family protein [Opitutales bacterium]
MELNDAIYQRRAVRHYTDAPVPTTAVEQLLQAARQAPSAVNQQPWAFGLFRDPDLLNRMSEQAKVYLQANLPRDLALHHLSDTISHPGYNVFHHASTLIVIYAKPARFDQPAGGEARVRHPPPLHRRHAHRRRLARRPHPARPAARPGDRVLARDPRPRPLRRPVPVRAPAHPPAVSPPPRTQASRDHGLP